MIYRRGNRLVAAALASTVAFAGMTTDAAAQTLHIMGPGGALEDRNREYVLPDFEQEHGVSIVYEAGSTGDIIAKMEAQKRNPQYDVIYLNDQTSPLAEELGLCAPLEPHPVYDELMPEARISEYTIGDSTTYNLLVIRTDIFEKRGLPEPESWLDLGNPAYEGELVLLTPSASTTGMSTLVLVARAMGGGEDNIDPGFTYIAEKVVPNVVTIGSSASKVQEMLQTGEVGIAVISSPRAAALVADGLPVKAIRPKEGVPIVITTICVAAGAPNPDLAQQYVQHAVSVEAQKGFLPGETPVNLKAEVPPAAKDGGTGEFVSLDWAKINAEREVWLDRWSREIER